MYKHDFLKKVKHSAIKVYNKRDLFTNPDFNKKFRNLNPDFISKNANMFKLYRRPVTVDLFGNDSEDESSSRRRTRVSLPDIHAIRRTNKGKLIAQVPPNAMKGIPNVSIGNLNSKLEVIQYIQNKFSPCFNKC